MTRPDLLLPGIAQRHRQVEDQMFGAGELAVSTEVTFALELVGLLRLGILQTWLHHGALDQGQGVGIDGGEEILRRTRVGHRKETVIQTHFPSWLFSMNNSLSYKGFELSVFLQGIAGNKIYNANNIDNTGMAAAYNQTTDVLKRWQGEGTSNSMPRAVFGDPNQNTRVSDRFVENGSYLRLKNITLSYTFPKQWLQKAQIENARLSLSCENVATITGYSGFDPEVGINGIDQNRYPISRTFSLGLNFNF